MSIITRDVSRPFHAADIPSPSSLRLQFIYNFFEADEKVAIGTQPPDRYPRAFKLDWSPLESGNFAGSNLGVIPENSDLTTRQEELFASIEGSQDPLDAINSADTLTRNSYFAAVQNYDFNVRVGERLRESAALRGLSTGSIADTAISVKAVLGESFDQQWLEIAGLGPESYGGLERATVAVDDDSNDESFQALLDEERARAAFREFEGSPAARASYNTVSSLKSLFVNTDDAPTLGDTDPSFEASEIPDEGSLASRPVLLGYMIEKFSSVSTDPQPARHVVRRGTKSYLDTNIVYGQTYSYRIRSITAVYNNLTVGEGAAREDKLCLIPFLSDPSKSVSLTAEETVPPPSPADFNLHWNYQDSTLQIVWSFPSNSQRDIKYWQVFRRSSINEPYSLIRMIDFDDSVERTPFPETIDNSLISKFQSPVNYYVDSEFNKDSDYIYTMCSVDAHGQSSNYGMQFRVRFDRYRNKLIKELISPSGAAKQYPNTYLNAELTLDSVKSSGSTKMRVYFDPEYLAVTNSDKRDQGFLRTSNSAIYQIQLINIDRQKQSSISVSISDPTNYVAGVVESATTT